MSKLKIPAAILSCVIGILSGCASTGSHSDSTVSEITNVDGQNALLRAFRMDSNCPNCQSGKCWEDSHGKQVCLTPPPGGVMPTEPLKLCINVKSQSHNYGVYVENYAEAWTTICGTETRIDVDMVTIGFRYKNERFRSNVCNNTSSCSFSERMYLLGATTFECVLGAMNDHRYGTGSTSAPKGYVCGP